MTRARRDHILEDRSDLAIAHYWYPLDVSNFTDWSLQWVIDDGGAGTATFALYGSLYADPELLLGTNYPTLAPPPAGTGYKWSTVPYAFAALPAGAPGSSILPVSDSAIKLILVELDVTVALERFSLAFHGQGRA